MADDGESTRTQKPKETFHRAQETQAEHKFPNHPAGVVYIPPGSRGPRSLYIKRGDNNSFGFTLRHFIVYPPDSVAEYDGRYAAVGAVSEPMETIFVRRVEPRSPAQVAGLQPGDRIVGVNRVPVNGLPYAEVVELVKQSPAFLHLLVVPKEEDVLQRYFSDAAHNPASNKTALPEYPSDLQAAQHFLTQTFRNPRGVQLDDISWRSLQTSYGHIAPKRPQRSADNLLQPPNEAPRKPRLRAQPQTPGGGMGRRASDGCTLSERGYVYDADYSSISSDCEEPKMKTMSKTNYLMEGQTPEGGGSLKYPGACRFSLDSGRRESSSSLTSSLADGSKDSLSSFDSAATLTGHETDDSAILSRYRRSFQQKEEFLRTAVIPPKEFHVKPKKMENKYWPPTGPEGVSVVPDGRNASKPSHLNFRRVKNDIDCERDLLGGVPQSVPQKGVKSPKEKTGANFNWDRMREASTAPASLDYHHLQVNGACTDDDDFLEDRRTYPVNLQMVSTRTKQFESGKPLPEDDPILGNRTSFYRSELARISSKRVVPNVTERAQEYETRSVDSKSSKESPQQQQPQFFTKRDTKSLESSDTPEKPANYLRARSNSADSWEAAISPKKPSESAKRISRQDALDDVHKSKDNHHRQAMMEISGQNIYYGDLPPPLIPVPVEHMHFAPSVSITPAPPDYSPQSPKAVRPTQLDLEGPVRPSRHLKPPATLVDSPMLRPSSPADDDRVMRRESYLKATEGGRMHFESDLSDGDISPRALRSAHRRWRPPMFPGDIQHLRKLFEDGASSLGGSLSGNSSSSVSLDRDKSNGSPVPSAGDKDKAIKEGALHCKLTEIDGKRFGDRSWKQIWAALRGPKLYLYKDKHHQSPVGASEFVEPSLSSGVDMRASVVRIAEDYTKRKNVLRVSSVNPCRSEFLLQADNTEELTDWVKVLQEQTAATTDVEAKFDSRIRQQAVPQTTPASTTIQVQGSRLSPQPQKSKSSTSRNRSPTGQSPVSKTRKPSQIGEPAATSPKSKTWRGRVAKQFRKMQGASSPSSPTAPEGSTFGVPLDQCLSSATNPYLPLFVETCTEIVDGRGLQTVGIYRVPGNNAAITAMSEEVNRNFETVPSDDPRWNDLHVVSSLLKSYFRKIPDSLVTNVLYPYFIKADKIEDRQMRMLELKRLVKNLPLHNYHTLKHLILHLKKVVDHSDVNKMEAKNLAIVFGPSIVRTDNMETMVNNMTHQCKIVETFLNFPEWFFSEGELETAPVPAAAVEIQEQPETTHSQALLLDNIVKYEALKEKEKNGALFSSIISAAQRKVKRKTTKSGGSLNESKEEVTTPTGSVSYPSSPFLLDLKNSTTPDGTTSVIPTTVTDIEKNKMPEKVPWFNYSTDQEDFHNRIKSFEKETNAMLQMPRKVEISVNDIAGKQGVLSSSASNVNQTSESANKSGDSHLLKTHSASNVFNRTLTTDKMMSGNRNSFINNSSYSVQSAQNDCKMNSDFGGLRYSNNDHQVPPYRHDNNNSNNQSDKARFLASKLVTGDGDIRNGSFAGRRGSSVENIHSSSMDLNANGNMKKIKFENETDSGQRVGSLESLIKTHIEDDTDLLTSLTKLYDKKLQEEKKSSQASLLDLPFADAESPEKTAKSVVPAQNLNDSYRNPSLHKSSTKLREKEDTKAPDEKEVDSSAPQIVSKVSSLLSASKFNTGGGSTRLKRSESLNKPERTVSPLNVKLKRSESLNKTGDRLKRLDSLTKNEKTESNLNKRRELSTSSRRGKDNVKLKRKNGMPDRSIKRRHTVGGTKDPDKVTWLLDNKYQEEVSSNKENKEKNLRTSSPDLSSTRREKLFFEISLIEGPGMMALKQHLMGARPQSFPDTAVFNVPLESHV